MEGKIVKPTKSKATSTLLMEDWHDLPFAALQAAARRFNLGRSKHGRFNWKQGDAAFVEERIKHLVRHVMLFAETRQQDDYDALICNAMMVGWFMLKGIMSETPFHSFLMEGKEESK